MTTVDDATLLLDLSLDPPTVERLHRYLALLLDANAEMNLTRITDPRDAESRLVAESLAILPLIPDTATNLIDVGTGGGIPGLPIAICRPDLNVTLLDATGKKVRFLEDVIQELDLQNVQAFQARSEDVAHHKSSREMYDVVVARAVARLPALSELVLPLTRVGGVAILAKGASVQDEIDEAQHAIRLFGGKLREISVSPINHARFVVLDKVNSTPSDYPRRPGIPQKDPIGVPSP